MSQDDDNIWYTIENTGDRYQVSNTGLIRNIETNTIRITSLDGCKYTSFSYTLDKQRHICRVHRLVAKAFIPNPESLPVVNHKDGNKSNNHVDNLEWCTSSYNGKHAVDTGLRPTPIGERNGRSILTPQKVADIRNKYEPITYSLRHLAKEYNVHTTTIRNIISGKLWKHIPTANTYKTNGIVYRGNSSGYRGVIEDKRNSQSTRWKAVIRIDGKKIHIGVFDDPIKAAYVYNQFAMQVFGDKAKLNEI